MAILTRRRIGGVAILAAASWLGQETLTWLWGKFLDLVSDGASNMTLAAFPWQNSIAFLLTLLGSYLAFWPVKKETLPTEADRARRHADRAAAIVGRIRAYRQNPYPLSRNEPLVDIVRDGISLLLDIQKDGYSVPQEPPTLAEQFAFFQLEYFSAMIPLWRDGHLEVAKSVSQRHAEFALQRANELNPENF